MRPGEGMHFGLVEVVFDREGRNAQTVATTGALMTSALGLFSLTVTPVGLTAIIVDPDPAIVSARANRLKQALLNAGAQKVTRALVSDDIEQVMPGVRRWAEQESGRKDGDGN